MKMGFPGGSVRGRMLTAAILIEATMLTLLVANSLRLLSGHLTDQAAQHAAQMSPVLNAALIAPLAQRDSATVKAILDECATTQGIDYLAVADATGKVVAASGWDMAKPLPKPDQGFQLFGAENPPRFDVVTPITMAGQQMGTVHFGLNLSKILAAHKQMLSQGMLIAIGELLLSAGLLTVVGFWLTRHLTALTLASEAVAKGNLTPPMVWEGRDDVGRLGAAFNAMSKAIRDRIQEITESRDIQASLAKDIAEAHRRLGEITHTMGDGLYVVDTEGRITFVNPRVSEILGWTEEELLGRKAHDLFHRDKDGGLLPLRESGSMNVLRTGITYRTGDVAFIRKDGAPLNISLVASPILRGHGTVGVVVSFQDVTEIQRNATALRISEERLAFAIEGSGDGLWDWDIPSSTVFYSRSWKEMLGEYVPGEIGSGLEEWESRLHPDDRERVLAELQQHLDGKAALYLSEHRIRRKDGSYMWVLDRGRVAELDALGSPIRVIGTHADITQRKSMERALGRKDQVLEAVSRSVIGLLDSESWEDGIPDFLQALGGASAASRVYIFRNHTELAEDGDVLVDQVFEWCAAGILPQIDNPELQNLPMRAAGCGRWVEELQADRMICGRVADFPEGEREILEAQSIRSMLVMPVHVRGVWWGMIGFDECESDRIWPSAEQEILRLAGRGLGAKIERAETRLELERLVAERTWELDQKNLDLIAEMGTRQEMEAANRTVMLELEHARKMESIGRLAAGIAHEINTPTQFLGNNLGFLRDAYRKIDQVLDAYDGVAHESTGPQSEALSELIHSTKLAYLKEEMPQAIEESIEGIERIAKIVRAMKEFSHPGGREQIPVDVNQCLVATTTVARNEWKYIAELNLDLDPSIPTVLGFSAELNQAFLNLIVNAADAIGERAILSPGMGQITVSTRSTPKSVEVRITDDGIGMSDEVRSRIFDPFFTTKSVGKGTGQGLTVCYQVVVTRHGGTIVCDSTPGLGTTFIIRLPLTVPAGLLEA